MNYTESLMYVVTSSDGVPDEELPDDFYKHVAAVFRELEKTNNPEDVEDAFLFEVNSKRFLLRLLNNGIPADMAIRAVELLAGDNENWFVRD